MATTNSAIICKDMKM